MLLLPEGASGRVVPLDSWNQDRVDVVLHIDTCFVGAARVLRPAALLLNFTLPDNLIAGGLAEDL